MILGTRGSDLALYQANYIKSLLEPKTSVEIKIIQTQGDQNQSPFTQIDAKGFFTKEIEEALLDKTIDLAVHSLKDLLTESPKGLKIAAIPQRVAPNDLLIIRKESCDFEQKESSPWILKEKGELGTSSTRRSALVRHFRPDIQIKPLRGNVPTRLQKLADKQYDAIILAQAGVDRLQLDLSEFEAIPLEPTTFIPAPGQGALALQIREVDPETEKLIEQLHAKETAQFVTAEREFLRLFEGGCSVPIGAYATPYGPEKDSLQLFAFVEDQNQCSFKNHIGKDSIQVATELYQKFSKESQS